MWRVRAAFHEGATFPTRWLCRPVEYGKDEAAKMVVITAVILGQ